MQNYVTILKQHAIQMEEKKICFSCVLFSCRNGTTSKGKFAIIAKRA